MKYDFQNSLLSWKGPEGDKSKKMTGVSGISMPSRGTVREGQVTVYFGPLGLRENIEIVLNDRGQEMTVSMNSLSGRVKIINNEPSNEPSNKH